MTELMPHVSAWLEEKQAARQFAKTHAKACQSLGVNKGTWLVPHPRYPVGFMGVNGHRWLFWGDGTPRCPKCHAQLQQFHEEEGGGRAPYLILWSYAECTQCDYRWGDFRCWGYDPDTNETQGRTK